MDKQALNNAIIDVITYKYKKDAQKAHKIVENAGYRITKTDGFYYICNDKTGKTIDLNVSRVWSSSRRRTEDIYKVWLSESLYFTSISKAREKLHKADLVAYLEKPYNREWQAVKDRERDERNLYNYKITRLKHLKWIIKDLESDIIKAKERISGYINEIERASADLESYTREKAELLKGGK